MGEQPAKDQDQDTSGRKTGPLYASDAPDSAPLREHSQGPHTTPLTTAVRRIGGAQAQSLRVLRRAIPTLRSRPTGTRTVEYRGRPRHLVISAILLTIILTFIMTVPLLPGQVQIEPG